MPQFSLKRLFVSVTLIAVGCASLTWSMRAYDAERAGVEIDRGLPPLAAIAGFAIAGAGLGNFFQRPIIGGLVGVLILSALIAIWGR
jgi:hypothetical protein